MMLRCPGRRGAPPRAVSVIAVVLATVLTASVAAGPGSAGSMATAPAAAPAPGPTTTPAWQPVQVRGLKGVVTEYLWNSRYEVAAAGFVEPGAAQSSLAIVRGGTAFILAKARVDGIIGWSIDETLLAYLTSPKDGEPLLCLYNPVARTLDFNDLPERAAGKARGGAWDTSGRLLIYTDEAVFIREGTGKWTDHPYPNGFALLPEPRFTGTFCGGGGALLLGTDRGRLSLWDLESDRVTQGPRVAGARTGGVNSRGNRVWTIRRSHPWRVDVYDLNWRALGHHDGLTLPEAAVSVHGWRLFFVARTRGQTTLWAWNLDNRRQSVVGPMPGVPGPIGLRISDDDRRLFILTGANDAILATPVPPE